MKYIDLNGLSASPYYSQDGTFLGVDEYGFTGDIFITTKEVFDKNSKNGTANSKDIQGDKTTEKIKNVDLTPEAESSIFTDVLKRSPDPNLDMSKLYNGKVSVSERSVMRGNSIIGKGYNNPSPMINSPRFNAATMDNGEIRVTVGRDSNSTDLYTVESIWNLLGVHEYWGHGVKKWGNATKTHWKCYDAQMKHPTFSKLPKEQQNIIKSIYREYYGKK